MIDQIAQQLLGLAEIGGNRLLGLDENVLTHCAELQGHIIAIHATDLDKTIYCHPGSWGLRLSLQTPGREADATIRGRLIGLVNLSLQEHKVNTSIQERIEISGNPKVAQKFQKILSDLDIDWEQELSRYTGDVLAFRIGQGMRNTQKWIKDSVESLSLSGREYLQEEIHYLPTMPEFELFKKNVTDIRHDVDRLEALIEHYQKSANS